MITVRVVLLILALICFVLATAGVVSRVNLVALGLSLWVLSLLIG